MISERISDDIPPQMKILNMVIPSNALLQSRLQLEHCNPHKAAPHPTKCDAINDVKLFLTVYRRIILSQFFYVSQSNVALQKQAHYNSAL